MPNGNISEFLKRDAQTNRRPLVRAGRRSFHIDLTSDPYVHSQLIDIIRGLSYLHSQSVVHGDMKGVCGFQQSTFYHATHTTFAQPNILINDNENAVLCDFGLASITADAESAHASTANSAGSIRWMAPERLSIFDGSSEQAPRAVRVTKESDMYSLAMVVIEVRTLPRLAQPSP